MESCLVSFCIPQNASVNLPLVARAAWYTSGLSQMADQFNRVFVVWINGKFECREFEATKRVKRLENVHCKPFGDWGVVDGRLEPDGAKRMSVKSTSFNRPCKVFK